MKVIYDATPFSTRHNKLGVVLKPGVNEFADHVANKLIDLGLVRPADPPAADEPRSSFASFFGAKEDPREREAPVAAASDRNDETEEEEQ